MKTQLSLADAQVIQRVLNLTRHPMFEAPHRDEFPAWHEAIADLGKLVQTVDIEGVASVTTQPGQSHWPRCAKLLNPNCHCSCGGM